MTDKRTGKTLLLLPIVFAACLFTACALSVPPLAAAGGKATVAPQATALPAPTTPPTPTILPTPTPFPEPTSFSIAWMTDTQEYAANNSAAFESMTRWIADTRDDWHTVLAVHTGDMIRDSYRDYEWTNMQNAFRLLPKDLPIVTVGGNHDIASYLPEYTPYLAYRPDTNVEPARSTADGNVYYMTLEAGDVPILVVSVTYGYEVKSQDWINQVCAQYADHYAILLFHSYLDPSGFSSVGRYLFPGVVEKSPNVRLILCGHEHGEKYKPDPVDDDGDGVPDRTVQQLLYDFQDEGADAVGFLRMLTFDTNADTIDVVTYSPYQDKYGFKGVGYDHFGAEHRIENAGIREFRRHPPGAPQN